MSTDIRNVLFLCTGNSARSILAEAIMNRLGQARADGGPRFAGFSAGSRPLGAVNPFALALLRARGHEVTGLRSKSWEVFAKPDAPRMDFIFTVCDNAAGETCPLWPGQPVTAHWGLPDPANVTGGEAKIAHAFTRTYTALEARISAFLRLPFDSIDPQQLNTQLALIGRDISA